MKYNLIILEGMSTSGKTTVMQLLSSRLRAEGIDSKGFEERQTMSREIFTHLDPRKSLDEMHAFLKNECSQKGRVVVCDRFHISHLVITKGSLRDLEEIEEAMKIYCPILVFLKIPEENVRERLLSAKSYRDNYWEDELRLRGETEDEAIAWFKGTQVNLFNLYQQSSLPKLLFDTSTTDFQNITTELLRRIQG